MSSFQSQNPGAFATGQFISELVQGCYAYDALVQLARDDRSATLVPDLTAGHPIPVGRIARKDDSAHTYDVAHYLKLGKSHPFIAPRIEQAWYAGAIVTASDEIKRNGGTEYFNHAAPELELIYHLRNGIAHGNIFTFKKRGLKRLAQYPAYNRVMDGRGQVFHVSSSLEGQRVLFDFMAAGDVVDLLVMAAERLKDLERGILGPGVSTSIFG
jgi:hypothetical protein